MGLNLIVIKRICVQEMCEIVQPKWPTVVGNLSGTAINL